MIFFLKWRKIKELKRYYVWMLLKGVFVVGSICVLVLNGGNDEVSFMVYRLLGYSFGYSGLLLIIFRLSYKVFFV